MADHELSIVLTAISAVGNTKSAGPKQRLRKAEVYNKVKPYQLYFSEIFHYPNIYSTWTNT